jgi:uncharacterized RDD family membrane protein YckC
MKSHDSVRRYPQIAKEPLLTSRSRPSPENRVVAKVIDTLLVESALGIFTFFYAPLVWVLAPIFWGSVERLGRGQSPGKWLLGLHTVESLRGAKVSFYGSFVRNFPFVLLSWGIGRSGWVAALCLLPAVVCLFIESYFIFSVRSGVRVGDIIGSTRVADYKDEHTKFIEQFLKEEEAV